MLKPPRLAFLCYDSALYFLTPIIFLYFALRGRREPQYRQHWLQRLGFGEELKVEGVRPVMWVHAASVGEVNAVTPLLNALQHTHQILVTTMTPTGKAQVEKLAGTYGSARSQAHGGAYGMTHRYVPLDTPGSVKRFLRRTKPQQCLIVETELWPNLIHYARQTGAVSLVNASVSEKSAHGLLRFPGKKLTAYMMACLHKVLAQAETDAERFQHLGADVEQIQVVGNLKYDVMFGANGLDSDISRRPHSWLAASTHDGEEALLLRAHQRILKAPQQASKPTAKFPCLYLAPRHPQRVADVIAACNTVGLSYCLHSEMQDPMHETEVYIVDTLGELATFYQRAQVAVVAGSFVASIGGHNILEPAALECPIVVGPYMHGFQAVYDDMHAAEGLLTVPCDASVISAQIMALLNDEQQREKLAKNACRVLASGQGAVQRTLAALP